MTTSQTTSDRHAARSRILAAGVLAFAAGTACAANATINPASNIFGYNGYQDTSSADVHTGWFRFGADGEEQEIWKDQKYGVFGTYFNVGYLRNGRLCGYYGNASQLFYVEFDAENGNQLIEREIDVNGENAIRNMFSGAYNPADDCIYGFAFNVDRSREFMVKAPASNPENVTIVREMPDDFTIMLSCCFSPTDNHMYGVDPYGDFIRADIYGNFQWIGEFKKMDYAGGESLARWESGITYSPKDNAFIWSRQYPDYTSDLVKIENSGNYKWSLISQHHNWDQFTIMACTDTDGDADGPAAARFVSVDFPGNALDGSVTFTMPEKMADGSDAPATMTWTATCGDNVQTGTAAKGANVTVSYSGLTYGEKNFTFRADAGSAKGASAVANRWIGKDNPMPPSDVTLTLVTPGNYKLTWKAPELGAHRGYLDTSKLIYAVFLDNEQVGPATRSCEADVQLPTDEATREYRFKVIAIADEMQSEFAKSNQVFTGRGYDLPYQISPSVSDAGRMTVINVDDDKSAWSFINEIGGGTAFFSNRDYDNSGDDYLITPPLWLDDASKKYNIEFEVKYHNPLKPEEFFDVWLGSEASLDGIREKRVAAKTRVTARTYYKVDYDFEIGAPGTYFLGIHYTGDPDQNGIYVRNIRIIKTNKPAAAVDEIGNESLRISVIPGAIGIYGLDGRAEVYSIDGRLAAAAEVDGNATVNVNPGIYIVRAAGKAVKVCVK